MSDRRRLLLFLVNSSQVEVVQVSHRPNPGDKSRGKPVAQPGVGPLPGSPRSPAHDHGGLRALLLNDLLLLVRRLRGGRRRPGPPHHRGRPGLFLHCGSSRLLPWLLLLLLLSRCECVQCLRHLRLEDALYLGIGQ